MSNYLLGAPQDYIPQIQSFVPDLNFYSSILQTKQSQYDAAAKQVNETYGALMNAPMSRMENIDRRDKFFKTIDTDVKKISKLDLSQEQNVSAAMNAFRPIYEDKNIINDMVKTKQLGSQKARMENFKLCIDPDKCGGMYSPVAESALNYWRRDFQNASREEAMGMRGPEFVPFQDVQGKMQKYADDLKMDVVVEHSNGRYIVRNKNGSQVTMPLHNALMAKFGNDPAIAKMFETQAYVERNQAVDALTPHYGGDRDAAESDYLQTKQHELEQKALRRDMTAKEQQAIIDNEQKQNAAHIKNYGANPNDPNDTLAQASQRIAAAKADADGAASVVKQGVNLVKMPIANKQSLINKVEGLLAQDYLHDHVDVGATTWAETHGETTIKEDAYGLAAVAHSYRISEKAADHEFEWAKLNQTYKLKAELFDYQHKPQVVATNPTDGAPLAGNTTPELSVSTSNREKVVELARQKNSNSANFVKITVAKLASDLANPADNVSTEFAKRQFKSITGQDYKSDFDLEDYMSKGGNTANAWGKAQAAVSEYKKINNVDGVTVANGTTKSSAEPAWITKLRENEVAGEELTATMRAVQKHVASNDKTAKSAMMLDEDTKGFVGTAFDGNRFVDKNEFTQRYITGAKNASDYQAQNGDGFAQLEFNTALKGGVLQEEAEKKYAELQGKYLEHEHEDNGKPGIVYDHYARTPGTMDGGTGGFSTRPINMTADLTNPNQEGTQLILGADKDIQKGNAETVVFGDGNTLTNKDYAGVKGSVDANAKNIMQLYTNWINSGEAAAGKARPVTQVGITSTAANDAGLVAYKVTLPPEFLQYAKLVGSKTTPGSLFGHSPQDNTITVFVRGNKTENPGYAKTKMSYTQIQLNSGGKVVVDNFPNGGHFQIQQGSKTGNPEVNGVIKYYNSKTKQLETENFDFVDYSKVDPQVIRDRITAELGVIQGMNSEAVLKGRSKQEVEHQFKTDMQAQGMNINFGQ